MNIKVLQITITVQAVGAVALAAPGTEKAGMGSGDGHGSGDAVEGGGRCQYHIHDIEANSKIIATAH